MDLVAGGGRWRLAMAGVVVALASAGCGGKTQREGSMPEPSNAGSASDATGGASGGSGHGAGATQMDAAAGASSNDCPVQQPVQGDACDDGQYCRYPIDECNWATFACIDHVWQKTVQPLNIVDPGCDGISPSNAPKDGDACKCLGQFECIVDDCAQRGQIHAVCDNKTWHVEDTPCPRQVCGPDGLSCDPDQICVAHPSETRKFACSKNPCDTSRTSCQCAASLCESFEICSMDSGTVVCEIPAR